MFCIRMMGGCNNDCKHCMVYDEMQVASHKDLEQLKEELKGATGVFDIFGGEPTIYPFFLEFLDILKERDLSCRLATNLRAFYYDDFAKLVAKRGVITEIRTSLYGPDAQTHNSITTVKGSFRQTLGGIDNAKKYGMRVLVNIVIMRPNFTKLIEMIKLLLKHDVDVIKFSTLLYSSKVLENFDDIAVKISEFGKYLQEALQYCEKNIDGFRLEKIPLCIDPRFSDRFVPENDSGINQDSQFMKPDICKECRFNQKCIGIGRTYAKIFGTHELKTQK